MAKKETGMNFMLYTVKTVEGETVRTPIAGQRGATLNRTMEELDATTKDTIGGYKDTLPGFMEWSIDADGVYVSDSVAFEALEEAFEGREALDIEFSLTDGVKYTGKVYITEFPIEAPYDDVATYTLTLKGSGAYTRV